MIKDKLYAFMGGLTERENVLQMEHERLIRKMKEEQDAITHMVSSKGWSVVEEYLQNRVNAAHVEMEGCKEKKLKNLQAEVKVIKGLFGFLGGKITQNFEN